MAQFASSIESVAASPSDAEGDLRAGTRIESPPRSCRHPAAGNPRALERLSTLYAFDQPPRELPRTAFSLRPYSACIVGHIWCSSATGKLRNTSLTSRTCTAPSCRFASIRCPVITCRQPARASGPSDTVVPCHQSAAGHWVSASLAVPWSCSYDSVQAADATRGTMHTACCVPLPCGTQSSAFRGPSTASGR